MHALETAPPTKPQPWSGTMLTGCAMAAGAVLTLVMVMQHPVVSHQSPAGVVAGIREQAAADRWVHGVLAVTMAVLTTGLLGLAGRLGLRRPHVAAGAVAACLALVFMCLAVLIDGFVAPALADRCGAVGASCAVSVNDLLVLGAVQIEVLTRSALFATAIAAGLFAADLLARRDGSRMVGAIGLASAVAGVGLLFATAARLNPHSLAVMVLVQAAWYLGVAALMIFRRGPYARSAGQGPSCQPASRC